MKFAKWSALLLSAALCAAMLSGCLREDAAPAASPSPTPAASPAATATPAASETAPGTAEDAAAGYTAAGLERVLDGCIAFGAGSAGTSLKEAIAANDLIRYTAQYGAGNAEAVRTDAQAWYGALDGDKKAQMAENWPGIRDTARAILDDPEASAGLLESAGVSTDFAGVDMETAGACLDVLDSVFAEN